MKSIRRTRISICGTSWTRREGIGRRYVNLDEHSDSLMTLGGPTHTKTTRGKRSKESEEDMGKMIRRVRGRKEGEMKGEVSDVRP